MDLDLVIRNGTLVTPYAIQADLGIRAGVIAVIGHQLHARRVVDAEGKFVLPGGVDPHVHLEMPVGSTTTSEDWVSGTRAAACGGTTTVIDFCEPAGGQSLSAALYARRAQAKGRATIDFGLHMTLVSSDLATLTQIPEMMQAGLVSFKTYTTFEGFRLDDGQLLGAMQAVQAAGGLVMVHAENDALVKWETRKLIEAGKVEPRYHALARPAIAETEAIRRVLALGRVTGAKTYIVHVSTAQGAEAISQARSDGQEVYGETCPQYLLLTEEELDRPEFQGAKFVCSPPLRKKQDNVVLWQALARNALQTVGTDHCAFNWRKQKELGRRVFTEIPSGLPGIAARLSLLYTFGVRQKQLTLSRWVQVCSSNPARLFGLYPRKGTLAPGSDADVVIFDPNKKVTLSQAVLHENVDYTPYEGLELQGYPEMTISRGVVVAQDGRFVGPPGHGRFLKRHPITNTLHAEYSHSR
jgi:dihydropyrimidinase